MLKRFYCFTLLLSFLCLFSFGADAVFRVHPKLNDAFTAAPAGLPASTVFKLSADQYTSGQTWSNATSGVSGGTEYDLFLGSNDTADGEDCFYDSGTPNKFDFDNTCFFQVKDDSTTFFPDMHKTTGSGARWIAFCGILDNAGAGALYGTGTPGTHHGIRAVVSVDDFRFQQSDGSSTFNVAIKSDVITDGAGLVIHTFNSSSTGSEAIFYASSTGAAWDNTYVPITSTTDAGATMQFGASDDGVPMDVNESVYALYGGTGILTDGDAALVYTDCEALTGEDFTP